MTGGVLMSYEIPGKDGPLEVFTIGAVDQILEELVMSVRTRSGKLRTSKQFWEEIDMILDARLHFM